MDIIIDDDDNGSTAAAVDDDQQGGTSVANVVEPTITTTLAGKRNLQIQRRKRRKIIDSDSNNNVRLMKNDTEDDEVEKVDFFDTDKLDENLEKLAKDLRDKWNDRDYLDEIKPKLKKLEDALMKARNSKCFQVHELLIKLETLLQVQDTVSKQNDEPLALTMEEENLEKLTFDDIDDRSTDRAYLDETKQKLEKLEKKLKNVDVKKYGHVCKLWSAADVHLRCLDEERKKYETKEMTRVEDIRYKVDTQALLHTYDLISFTSYVLELFKWHDNEHVRKKYMAPSFPMVQSSGMGKTKLLFEFRTLVEKGGINGKSLSDYDCRTILCLDAKEPKDENKVDSIFSGKLVVLKNPATKRTEICNTLDALLTGCTKKKVIFLFDEAQHLLVNDEGYHFQCVRWWLRRRRAHHQVVAVFTGTTLHLASPYHEPATSTTSRDAGSFMLYHQHGSDLYPPFYELCTIGVTAKPDATNDGPDDTLCAISDYDKAIPYGRPLFALMNEDKHLQGNRLCNILKRMVLQSSNENDWKTNVEGCLSILGTRLQMGQMSETIASKLVSNGYAWLTHYSSSQSNGVESVCHNVIRLTFPTDPVCARLAMALMDDTWTPDDFQAGSICPRCKGDWVWEMSKIFSSGLCQPNQGGLGEIAAAAYLLFCGDVLRKKRDKNYIYFSVLLTDFVQCLLRPGAIYEQCGEAKPTYVLSQVEAVEEYEYELDKDEDQMPEKMTAMDELIREEEDDMPGKTTTIDDLIQEEDKSKKVEFTNAEIGFIQVVGNYLHLAIENMKDQNFMKGLYDSGCAFYVYQKCFGVDLIGSIRLTCTENKYHYVPLFVSVSTTPTRGYQRDKLNDMTKLLADAGMIGFCIRVLFARPGEKIRVNENHLTEADVARFLRGEIVSKILIVPADDPFGIVPVLLERTSLAPPMSEVYSSHNFLPLLSALDEPATLVRKAADEDLREYIRNMRNGIQH